MLNRHFSRFEPALTPILTEAFDRAWKTVEASGVAPAVNGDAAAMREAIALRIIAMADAGMTNPTELAMDALSHASELKFPQGGQLQASR
jgi:hypothetical protein